MTVSEIRHRKFRGDYKVVSYITDLSISFVKALIYKNRNLETENAKKIIKAFSKVIEQREQLKAELNQD